jgi:non-specific serine/threonine protein kinase
MLQGLIEHSLLRCWASGRLGMLETIHEFALKKLEEHGNLQSLRRRHAEWLLSTLESANLCVEAIQSELPNRYDIASPEVENARAALQWALESGEIQVGLKLATSLEQFWVSSLPFEGARWFEELLSVAPDLPLDLRARALRAFGGSVYIVGEFERGRSLYDESLALYRSLGDERGVGHLIFRIAYDEFRRGNHTKARELVRESLDIHERLGVRADESQSLTLLAELAELDGDYAGALVLYEQSAERARDSGFIWWLQGALLSTAELALRIGDPARACSALREVLELVNTTGDRQHTVYGLAIAAALAAGRQDPYHCGVFWGFLTTEESRGKVGQWESSADRDHVAALVHAQAGPELQHGMQEGSLMTRDEILLRAIAWLDEPSGKMAE